LLLLLLLLLAALRAPDGGHLLRLHFTNDAFFSSCQWCNKKREGREEDEYPVLLPVWCQHEKGTLLLLFGGLTACTL
jgi:hypothetical protein